MHFFGLSFISTCGAFQWFFSLGERTGCIGYLVLRCHLSTFLSHSNNTSFFLLVFFDKFWQKHFVNMWGHYGSMVMGVYSRPFNKVLGLTINILWWYKPFIYKRSCPIFFLRIRLWWFHICVPSFVFSINPFWRNVFLRLRGAPTSFNHAFM